VARATHSIPARGQLGDLFQQCEREQQHTQNDPHGGLGFPDEAGDEIDPTVDEHHERKEEEPPAAAILDLR
jgi:hypothetical protein